MGEILAGNKIDLVKMTNPDGIVVAGTGTAYTKSAPLPTQASFSILLRATSSGAIALDIEIEQSNERPTTEGAEDIINYAVPIDSDGASVGEIVSMDGATMYVINFTPVASGFFRLKATGTGSNAADTTLVVAQIYYVG